jgi:hypothetical protein
MNEKKQTDETPSLSWTRRFILATKTAPIGHDIFGAGSFLALLVLIFMPFPVGFKDQGRGPLAVMAFVVGGTFGCAFGIARAMRAAAKAEERQNSEK